MIGLRRIMAAVGLTFLLLLPIQAAIGANYNFSMKVEWVQDGDTFRLENNNWVRLADVDAPENNTVGYNASLSRLINLIQGRTVYLDCHDRTDTYGRLVCVAYVHYNSTHYLNVNKAMVDEGYAAVDDYPNKFSPGAWTLYVPNSQLQPYPASPDYTLWLIAVIVIMAIAAIAILYYLKRRAV